jgi:hypothetical protein
MHHDDAARIRSGELIPGDVNNYTKSFGLVVVPVFNKVGISTHQKIQVWWIRSSNKVNLQSR